MNVISKSLTYWKEEYAKILDYTLDHLILAFIPIVLAILLAVPLGIYLAKTKHKMIKNIVFSLANIIQTVPSIAMFAIMIPVLGIGFKPAVVGLFLYSLFPILQNTYAGVTSIDPNISEAAKGMGFNKFQQIIKIDIPIAMPYIMSGVRVTTVYIISWTTLAAVIGAGGLGNLILGGIASNKIELVMTGTIIAVLIALFFDAILGRMEKRYQL